MKNSQNFSQTLPQISKTWQITTLANSQKFTGLGNFGTKEINPNIPVLVNEKGQILAIPGLIGGENSKSENNSLDLILEVANFEGEMVAKSAFDLNYRSNASKIWAGNVSRNLPELFQEKMIEILDLWQKEMQKEEISFENKLENNLENKRENDKNFPKLWQIQPILKWSKNNNFLKNQENLSKNLEESTKKTLEKNQFETKIENKNLSQFQKFTPKRLQNKQQLKIDFEYLANGLDSQGMDFWRPIIIQKLNLIGKFEEKTGLWQGNLLYGNVATLQGLLCELIRLIGFEKLKTHHLTMETGNNFNQSAKKWELIQNIKDFVQSFGFSEIITRPFISAKNTQLSDQNAYKVLNPYNSNLPFLRNSLLPSLLQIASLNAQKGWKNLNIFEINQIFTSSNPKQEILDSSKDTKNTKNSEQNLNEKTQKNQQKIEEKTGQNAFEKNINMQIKLGIISLENPYLLTTLARSMAEKLGFDSMTFEKLENNLGQITILTWQKENRDANLQNKNSGKLSLENEKNSQNNNLATDLESNLVNNSPKKNDQNLENGDQNQPKNNLIFKITQLKNSLKKEFGLSLDKSVWYLETEIGDWRMETLDKYFDELDFPSISRDYSLSISQIGGKNWQEIKQIIGEIPADFMVKTWPKEYFVNQIKSEITDQIENQSETKISFKVKFQSHKETLKSEQIDNWEKEMMIKLIQK